MPFTADTALFTLSRQLAHPPQRVWRAWSEAAQLQQWWGPAGCELEVNRFEFQPGGVFHYTMQFPAMPAMWGRFCYREIVPQQRLVWLNSFATAEGGIARAPFSADCPLEVENTLTFSAADGLTTLTLQALPFGATAEERQFFADLRPSLAQGYGATLDQLAALLDR